MPWFKVDDNLAFHAKTVAAGNAAMGLWVRAGSWCAQQLTDGHVPAHMVTALGKTSDAKRLVAVGLWTVDDSGDGYRFHQWDDRNPRRDQVEEDRAAARERMKKAREHAKQNRQRSANVRANTDRTSDGVRSTPRSLTPTRPDPTRPDPVFSDENTRAGGACAPAATATPSRAVEKHTHTTAEALVDEAGPAVPAVRARLVTEVDGLLTAGTDTDAIRRGLSDWHRRPRAAAGLLPHLVQDQLDPARTVDPRFAGLAEDARRHA